MHFKGKAAHQTGLWGDAEVPTQEGSCLENWTRRRRAMLLKALEKKVGRAGGSATSSAGSWGLDQAGGPHLPLPANDAPGEVSPEGTPALCPEAFPLLRGDMWCVLPCSTCLYALSPPGCGQQSWSERHHVALHRQSDDRQIMSTSSRN